MNYFKQAVEMMLMDHQAYGGTYGVTVAEHLTNKLISLEVELECERAAKTISLEQGDEVVAMDDLYMMVYGDGFDINTLSSEYPILAKKLDELWCIIDSDYIDDLEKNNDSQSK